MAERTKDPRYLPSQLNVNIPWAFREFLIEKAEAKHISLTKLVHDALSKEYGVEFAVRETRQAGATR